MSKDYGSKVDLNDKPEVLRINKVEAADFNDIATDITTLDDSSDVCMTNLASLLLFNSIIPNIDNALFWLNGAVEGNYFMDQSGNDRNFLITGKDFTEDYFPYKSNATISAPIADATLISADINNFLYDSGGTPNEIPVNSFFQNIDYENKLFCKNELQTVDSNDVETQEAYVNDIAMYSSALSGADLILANMYYSVPTEDLTAIWIDPVNGLDSNVGTKVSPWKTMSKAETSSNVGDTVYVKTGVVLETSYIVIEKQLNWKILGYTILKSTGTSYVLICKEPDNLTLNRLIIDGETNTAVLNSTESDSNGHLSNVKYINPEVGATYSVFLSGDGTIHDKSIFPNSNGAGKIALIGNSLIKNSLINSQVNPVLAGKTFEFINNKIVADAVGDNWCENFDNDSNLTIKGGLLHVINGSDIIYSDISALTSELSMTYMDIIIDNCSSALVKLRTGSFSKMIFSHNNVTNNSACSLFSIPTATNIDMYNNIFNSNGIGGGLSVYKTLAGLVDNNIVNNTLKYINPSGIVICVGSESTSSGDDTIDAVISKNKLLGQRKYEPDASTTMHGIFLGFQSTTSILGYNRVNGVGMGIVLKGSSSDYSDVLTNSNIVENCRSYGIYFKGTTNNKVYNNTLINNGSEFTFSSNTGGDFGINQTIKNCIAINEGGYLYTIDTGSEAGHSIDYNIYYSDEATPFKVSGVDKTWTEWKALGYDAHSTMLATLAEAKALFTDYDNGDYSLIEGSAAIGAGVDLGATYDDGLDASTDWGDDTEIPTVVTKQQTGSWDVGAYVS